MKTEYKVIVSSHEYQKNGYAEFIMKVNELLAEGWKCQGGVSISHCPSMYGGSACYYAQAMIRETDD